jgi:hypothetical protein
VARCSYAAPGDVPARPSRQSSPRALQRYDACVLSLWGIASASLRYFPSIGGWLLRSNRRPQLTPLGIKLHNRKQCLDQSISAGEPAGIASSQTHCQPLATIEVRTEVYQTDVRKLRPYPALGCLGDRDGGQATRGLLGAGERRKHEPRMAIESTASNPDMG